MKTKRLTHHLKILLISIFTSILFVTILIVGIIKLLSPFKVSVYNYESYLDKKIINKIKKDYSYHVFTNLDEFTKAIKNKKAVAGVSSDYQIAELILENKIKKINFEKAFDLKDLNEEKIMNLYSRDTKEQFDYFDWWIIQKIKEKNPNNIKAKLDENKDILPYIYYEKDVPVGFEIDGKTGIDKFYQFLIPYFTLDKMVVYNTEDSEIYKSTRNNIKENVNFNDIKDGLSWEKTISMLVSKYKKPKVYWTNWFQDNLMIGQFHQKESEIPGPDLEHFKWKLVNKKNYKNLINSFSTFVEKSTGATIKNSNVNKLVTDGQELVSSIIEPKSGKADIAIMYNGDALDAYYGRDNFIQLNEKNNISFVRPKYSYKNIDAWIISKDTRDFDSDLLLDKLNKTIFSDVKLTLEAIEKLYIENVYNLLIKNDSNKKLEYDTNLFKDNLANNTKEYKNLSEINDSFFKENYGCFKKAFQIENLTNIMNFNTINYTPSYKTIKEFIRKWYFLDKNKQPDEKAISIFDLNTAKNTIFRPYQPLDLELRTKLIDWYYEKTKS
ncbi:hypothetical protein DMC14_003015 [Metamycoplasma phocicerebrale]|uniref:Spermidine/putrescine ABC transporter substrate-binding protein n=1 Tax=Metamycoplasma phocicerebrale TaxID=142649 RepID=A0A3Q9VAH8_9BACT|nr:hypothetical protein [Metamycoplasma phocicerebrale]AZZ65735.1 hypothetical protein DMC14_003015 [Metamycoplasma phocicerebrale]